MVNMKTIKRLTISKNPIQDVVGIHGCLWGSLRWRRPKRRGERRWRRRK